MRAKAEGLKSHLILEIVYELWISDLIRPKFFSQVFAFGLLVAHILASSDSSAFVAFPLRYMICNLSYI